MLWITLFLTFDYYYLNLALYDKVQISHSYNAFSHKLGRSRSYMFTILLLNRIPAMRRSHVATSLLTAFECHNTQLACDIVALFSKNETDQSCYVLSANTRTTTCSTAYGSASPSLISHPCQYETKTTELLYFHIKQLSSSLLRIVHW